MNAIETRVLELIGENTASPDVFTDDSTGMAQIRTSIGEAVQEIVMLTGGYKRKYFIPLRSGTAFYRLRPLEGEVGWISDAYLTNPRYRLDQTDLIKLTANNPRWMIPSAAPVAYLPIGQDVIGFYPKPSSDSDVVELDMVEIPSVYTADTDLIKVRNSYKYATVNYAVSEFWASRGDANEAQNYMQMYRDALGLNMKYAPQNEAPWKNQTTKVANDVLR